MKVWLARKSGTFDSTIKSHLIPIKELNQLYLQEYEKVVSVLGEYQIVDGEVVVTMANYVTANRSVPLCGYMKEVAALYIEKKLGMKGEISK